MKIPNYQHFRKLYGLLRDSSATYDEQQEQFVLEESTEPELQQVLGEAVHYRKGRGKLRLDKNQFGYALFADDLSFRRRAHSVDRSRDIGVLNLKEEKPRFWEAGTGTVFLKFERAPANYFFGNAQTYHEMLDLLEELNRQKDGAYEFVDFFNKTDNKVVFTSAEGKGRVILNYTDEVPDLPESKDLSRSFRELKRAFDKGNKNFPVFLKNELITHLKWVNSEDKLRRFFTDLDTILDNAKVGFNVYLHELSIEKIKREYKEYKDKYFEQINSILKKLTNQIITLPITILGAAYAIEKAGVSLNVQVIILIAIVLTSVLLIYFIRLYKTDLDFIEQTFRRDYHAIRQSGFFQEHKDEIKDFEMIEQHIRQRIRYVRGFLWVYYWTMLLFNAFLIGLILLNLGVSVTVLIASGIVVLIVLGIVFRQMVLKQ